MKLFIRPFITAFFLLLSLLPAPAALAADTHAVAGPHALRLSASPQVVDVGGTVILTLTAQAIPSGTAATLAFVSPHHGFSGKMQWRPSCSCFVLGVVLAKRVHPLETASATATLTWSAHSVKIGTTFRIRGLARNGHGFAPGGNVALTAWVADPEPLQNENEHFCASVTTADQLGVRGYSVRFVVHYQKRVQSFTARITATTGVACEQRSIGFAHAGFRVHIDVYAAGQHADAYFTPRRLT